MKLQIKLGCFLVILLCLSGCVTVTPHKLGISQEDWDQYSPAKQDQLLSAYEETQQRKKATRIKSGSGVLAVRIEEGKILLPPYTVPVAYQPILFDIKEGQCRKKFSVEPVDESHKAGTLEACYQDDTLYLDPSPYNPQLSLGSLQFPYLPAWKRGFMYPNVSSTGLLQLTDTNIFLQQLVESDND